MQISTYAELKKWISSLCQNIFQNFIGKFGGQKIKKDFFSILKTGKLLLSKERNSKAFLRHKIGIRINIGNIDFKIKNVICFFDQ